jgi:CubicO group peptidase (beta-lactamase class C family)
MIGKWAIVMTTAVMILCFHGNASCQLTPAEIDQLMNRALKEFKVAGASIGVVKDGKVVHAKGYGVRSVETGEPVDERTLFAIASNSKAFTTTALAILVDEGKLSWEDRVVDLVPGFKMYNDYVTQQFNIQDLLTHRSGLGLGAGDLQFWPAGSDFTMDDLLTNFQHFEPVSAFRTRYDYDNILYAVAGEVIRRVSGLRWETFMKQRILEPLGMDDSYTLPPGLVPVSNMAAAHLAENGNLKIIPYYEIDTAKINGAAVGVLSCAEDLCRWMLVHLNGGQFGASGNKRLFSTAAHQEMWCVHTPMKVRESTRYSSHFAGYGLGWRLDDLNGNLRVSHTGDISGMLSMTIMIPDLKLGVVILTNSYYGGAGLFRAVSQTIVDSYLGLEERDWIAHYLELSASRAEHADLVVRKVWETTSSGNHGHVNPEDYTGEYEDPWFGRVRIHLKNDSLWFTSLRSPRLEGPMYHYKANAFAVRWETRELDADAFAIFTLDEEGKAAGFTMKGISPLIDFSYDFQDLHFTLAGYDHEAP